MLTASREAVSAKQSGPSVPGPGVAFTPLDWSTDAGMEIPPTGTPTSPQKFGWVGGTRGKNFWVINRARPLTFARNLGTPTMRGSAGPAISAMPVSDGRPEKGGLS